MNTPDKNAGTAAPAASCDPACACPPAPSANDNTSQKPRGFLRGMFRKCAACAGSGAAGFLVGHAGCLVTPLVIAAAGVTTATAGVSALALAFGAAATAGGLYAWHKLRGQTATRFEKRLVIGSAITGLLASTIMMQLGGHDHHSGHDSHKTPVPQHQMHHEHHGHGQHGQNQHGQTRQGANDNLTPAAAAFYSRLSEEEQKRLRDNAALLKMSMGEYLNGLCITPAAPQASAPPASGVRMAKAPAP